MIHDTEMSAEDYKIKLFKRYPLLAKHPDLWKVDVVKKGRKLTKIQRGRKYDSLYYDSLTVDIKQIVSYLTIVGHPQVIPVDMSKPIRTQSKTTTQRIKHIAYSKPTKVKSIKKPVKRKK